MNTFSATCVTLASAALLAGSLSGCSQSTSHQAPAEYTQTKPSEGKQQGSEVTPSTLDRQPDLGATTQLANESLKGQSEPLSDNAVVGERARLLSMPQRAMVKRPASGASQAEIMGFNGDMSVSFTADSPSFTAQERYQTLPSNGFVATDKDSFSTFAIDVDSQAYANVRSLLQLGEKPVAEAIRTEEMINYFGYQYPEPHDEHPFAIWTELSDSPFSKNKLLHIGLQGKRVEQAALPPANLVFLVDVSGSMNTPNKLPLVQRSLKLLARQMGAQDSLSLVAYAGADRLVLPATKGTEQRKILAAIERLSSGGGTHGEAGIKAAYQQAQTHFIPGGINRVILASDGDFNVGIADVDELKRWVAQQRETGIELSTLTFGRGNTHHEMMEQLANTGNGNAGYVDSLREAQKLLVQERAGTLMTIAKDVKVQIEFNPATVKAFRLVGYENRRLSHDSFANDQKDAGELGAGHSVTAIYEVVLAGEEHHWPTRRYRQNVVSQTDAQTEAQSRQNELALLKLRYKQPDSDISEELEQVIATSDYQPLANTSNMYRFSASVAAFAEMLRSSDYVASDFDYRDVANLARQSLGEDQQGYRREFVALVDLAGAL